MNLDNNQTAASPAMGAWRQRALLASLSLVLAACDGSPEQDFTLTAQS